ncbi:MAG: radical SAM protein [Candidatus Wallbacteria bacterium]|nr:radical SAM protein [Candidatus Wallbacteria bacterium]
MLLLVIPAPSRKAPVQSRISLSLGALAAFVAKDLPVRILYDTGNDSEFLELAAQVSHIGFTGMTYQMTRALELAGLVKSQYPEKIVIFGGPCAGLNHSRLFSENSAVDWIVTGEGEQGLSDILAGFPAPAGAIKRARPRFSPALVAPLDITSLPVVSRELLPDAGLEFDHAFGCKSAVVMFSRGCSGSCTFCATPVHFGRPRFRTPEQALAEMDYIASDFGVDCFAIEDDDFLFCPEFVSAFAEGLLIGKKYRFRVNLRLESANLELLELLVRAGLHKVTIGIEHSNPQILKLLGKQHDPGRLRQVLSWCRDLDLPAALLFMAGCPGETCETLNELRCSVNALSPSGGYDFQVFQPHPGHAAEKIALSRGHILTRDFDDFFSDNITFLPEAFHDATAYRDVLRSITGKMINLPGSLEIPFWRQGGGEFLIIHPDSFSKAEFDIEAYHWQGSDRCRTGLSIIKCRNCGVLEYSFCIKNPETVTGMLLHGRFASHPLDWPQGDENCSDVSILLNNTPVTETVFRPVHTIGEAMQFELMLPDVSLKKENTLSFVIKANAQRKNGLSIFYRPLCSFYHPLESPLVIRVTR